MTDLSVDVLDSELLRLGYGRSRSFHGTIPTVVLIDGDQDRIAGRFFPSRNAILAVRFRRPEVTQALVNHELTHAWQYVVRCGGTCSHNRRKCGYVGQHDARFYRHLEELHRSTGVRPSAARVVEEQSGYDYPRARWAGRGWP